MIIKAQHGIVVLVPNLLHNIYLWLLYLTLYYSNFFCFSHHITLVSFKLFLHGEYKIEF